MVAMGEKGMVVTTADGSKLLTIYEVPSATMGEFYPLAFLWLPAGNLPSL